MNNWTKWIPFPKPEEIRQIEAPKSFGVYQLRNTRTNEYVLFGIGGNLNERMKSLMPKPYGIGTRNNTEKRGYVLANHKDIKYRITSTQNREEAKRIEENLKAQNNHIFNT